MRAVDYIIVGQGLAGSCLALELIRRHRKILVVDFANPNSASRVAAGIYNPVTGRTNQPTWRAKEMFSCLREFYLSWENLLGVKFLNPLPIYRPFVTTNEQGKWPSETNDWIGNTFTSAHYSSIQNPYGGIVIKNGGHLNTSDFLSASKKFILSSSEILFEPFAFDSFRADEKIQYKDFTAQAIIFCEGCSALVNPWFSWLPLRKLKGELLLVKADLPADVIVNRGVFAVPFGNGSFLVGSTYTHDESDGNSPGGIEDILARAQKLFNSEVEIVDKFWGHRPTTIDRRPILGPHPKHKNICIFNGLGTKGVSLAPFFALHLADWLESKLVLDKDVNIERFYSLSFKSN